MSRCLNTSTTTQMAKNMVQYGRSSRSSWTKSVWSSFGRTMMGKTIWENPIETWLGENSKLGMSFCSSWKRIILICVCGWHKTGWKETKHWSDVETTQQRSRFGRTNIFLGSCTLGMHSTTMWNKQRYCGQLQNHVRIANFRLESREINIFSKSSYFFMVLWYGWSCKEMCGTILWVGEQDDSTTLPSIYSMHRWPPLQRGRSEICGRIVTSMLSKCSEMLILGTNWETWYSMVSEQTCTIDHKMDQSLWPTIISFDLLQSSHMWLQTILLCGKHCKTMQIGTVSKLRFCRRSWGFKIFFRSNIVYFWKSYICSNQLDVWETNFSFAQFNGIRNYLFGCRIKDGRHTRTWFMGSDRHSSSRKHASEWSSTERPV